MYILDGNFGKRCITVSIHVGCPYRNKYRSQMKRQSDKCTYPLAAVKIKAKPAREINNGTFKCVK